MNLAARLDRLCGRARQAEAAADAPGDGAADDLGMRLQRLRPGRRGRATVAAPIERLGEALSAGVEGSGLLHCVRSRRLAAEDGGAAALSMLPEVCDLAAPGWVYVDTETTGLCGGVGNLAFMVGMARYAAPDVLEVRQFVLGSFAGEAQMLRALLDGIGPHAVLVSYNGRSFDVPLLAARLGMHRIEDRLGMLRHLDLMYSVRRAYRQRWPDCRLQTAERRLLGMQRGNDLPGAEAPGAWRAWLEHGDTAAMRGVLEHNFQDVVSLALLHRRLVLDYAGGGCTCSDPTAVARAWYGAGRLQQARCVLERAGDALDEQGRLLLARLYRREGDWCRAEALWRDLHRSGCTAASSELSKYYEHRLRDYPRAMGFAHACAQDEREARTSRLQRKIGDNLPLPW